MLLRRVTEHVKQQNWFAVTIDFFIVVLGVFIGLQVANWNAARDARTDEQALILRLEADFEVITSIFDDTLEVLPTYLDATRNLVAVARGEIELPEYQLKSSAYWSQSLGRPPLRSTTYDQLVSSGDFSLIRDATLRDALVRYHQSVDRQSFLYTQTLSHLVSMADYMDIPIQLLDTDTEISFPLPKEVLDEISVDHEALKASEGAFEILLTLQFNLHRASIEQNALAGNVKAALERILE